MRLTAERLTPAENQMLQALTLVAGAVLPADVVGLIADVDDAVEVLDELAGRGLVTRRDDSYGLPLRRTTAYRQEAVDGLLLGRAARVLADQLVGHGGDGDVLDVADAAVRLLRLAAEYHDWATVLRLVEAVEPVLSLAGKWDTARDVLRIGIGAAHWVGDPQTEARLRRRLDAVPSAGPALLTTLRALVRRLPRWPRRAVTAAVLAVSLLSLVIAGARAVGRPTTGGPPPPGQALAVTPSRLDFAARPVGSPSAVAVVTVGHRGGSPSDALTVSLTLQRGDFAVASDGCTGRRLAPQQVCAVKVVFRPADVGTRRATLTVTPAGGTPQQVMLEGVGRAIAGPRLALPGALRAEATGPEGARVRFRVSATDASGRPLTPRCTPESGDLFVLGVTTVSCRATDSANHTTSGQFRVTVSDSTAPQILVAPTTFEADSPEGARSTPYEATATDAVSGTLPVRCTGAPSLPADIDEYPITCTARDAAGNEATKTVVLSVVDTRPPVILDLPTEVTAGESVDLSKTRAQDAVDGRVPVECTPTTPQPEQSTVSCTATDSHGNTAHDTVRVVRPPEPTAPPEPPPTPGPVS